MKSVCLRMNHHMSLLALIGLIATVGYAKPSGDLLDGATEVKVVRDGQTFGSPSAMAALKHAQRGDIIKLGAGTHQGPLILDTPNITLCGKVGTLVRVNGNDATWQPSWQRALEYGSFAWRSEIPFEPVTMSIDQRAMIHATESRGGLSVHAQGAGRGGRTPLRGVFTYLASQKQVVVSFASDLQPSEHDIEAARKGSNAIVVQADNCTVRNLIATGGDAAILLTHTSESVVDHCLVYAANAGIRVGQNATRCKVSHCDITWNQDAVSLDCDRETGLAGDDVWITHKRFGTYDKWGIEIDRAGPDNEVCYNYVYDVWNGIQNSNGVSKDATAAHYRDHVFKGISTHNVGLKVHHNRVDLTMDDALEPGNELVDNHWYSNVVTRARCAARFKTIEMGPFYFYDNTLLQCGDGLRLYKTAPKQATVFIFNNVVEHPNGIIYHKVDDVAWGDAWLRKNLKRGTPGFALFNNLFICEQPFANQAGSTVTPNFKSDFNLYTASHDPAMILRGFDKHSLFNAHPQFVDPSQGNYALSKNSVGQQRGINIASQIPHAVNLPISNTLQPSMGRLNIDADQTPRGPVSGLWYIAQNPLNLGERDITYYRQEPMRWVSTKQQSYRITEHTDDKPIVVKLVSAQRSRKTKYTVRLTDAKGKELDRQQGPTATGKAQITLKISANAHLPATLELHDGAILDWRVVITSNNASLEIDASKLLNLRKYDGGSYRFIYRVTPENTSPFAIHFAKRYNDKCAIRMTNPQAQTSLITSGQVIHPQGQVGLYQFDFNFTKKADIRLEATMPYLVIPMNQPVGQPKVQWGKPNF